MARRKNKPDNETKKGRPNGARNVDRDVAVGEATRCKSCGCTDRTPYKGKPQVFALSGVTVLDGKRYTHQVKRRTSCMKCGRHRWDTIYENRAIEAIE